MKKSIKFLAVLIAIGAVIGIIIAYFCKSNSCSCCEDDNDFMEEDDFDLDNDLQPASEREYVPLHKAEESKDESPLEDAPPASAAETSGL